jgi:integrase
MSIAVTQENTKLLGLRWEDVDLDRGRIRVAENYVRGQFTCPKSGKPREVPLSGEAREALAAHRHTRGERVFCDAQGRPFTQGRDARAATVAAGGVMNYAGYAAS